MPTGPLGALLISALGEIQSTGPYIVPDIGWDGVIDPARLAANGGTYAATDRSASRTTATPTSSTSRGRSRDATKPSLDAVADGVHARAAARRRDSSEARAARSLALAACGDNDACTLDGAMCEQLSYYGLFDDIATQQPAAGVTPYDLKTPLFSDYTTKHRFLALPPRRDRDVERSRRVRSAGRQRAREDVQLPRAIAAIRARARTSSRPAC